MNAYESDTDISLEPIFTTVTISQELSEKDIEDLGERTLSVTAFAVQTANINAETASNLAAEQFGLTGAEIAVPSIE